MVKSDTESGPEQPRRRGWRRLFKVFGFMGTAAIVLFAVVSGDDPSDAVRNSQRDDKQREN